MISKRKLTEHVWLLDDNGESTGYVVTGTKKAMVIDTMNGSEDVRKLAESITDLPLIVVNTHSHPDHIGGNHFFDEVYMHAADVPFADMFTRPEVKKLMPKINTISEGDIFDLGGLHLEVYELPGHTPGSICLLLSEDRILFTGDAVNRYIWMQLDGCISLAKYVKNLERIEYLTNKADFILHGHTKDFDPVSLYKDMENGIKEITNQKGTEISDSDEAYEWFGGVGKIHFYGKDHNAICYRVENIE